MAKSSAAATAAAPAITVTASGRTEAVSRANLPADRSPVDTSPPVRTTIGPEAGRERWPVRRDHALRTLRRQPRRDSATGQLGLRLRRDWRIGARSLRVRPRLRAGPP